MDQQNQQVLDAFFKDFQYTDNFDIIAIIDRSGSMEELVNDVIGGYNTFLEEQKKEGGSYFSMVQFDNVYGEPAFWRVPIRDVAPLDKDTYKPRGGTALFDAIGKTIAHAKQLKTEGQITGKVMFLIQTDGEENASQDIRTKEQLTSLIDDARKNEGWEFIFLGADLAAFTQGSTLGFAAGSTAQVSASAVGIGNSFKYAAALTRGYRNDVHYDEKTVDLMKSFVASDDANTVAAMDEVYAQLDEQIKTKVMNEKS